MTATVSTAQQPKVLYTSADADAQGGALRCLFDMGNEIGNWGYRPIFVLSNEADGSSPADGNGRVRDLRLAAARDRSVGRSIASYLGDLVETVRSARRLARIIRREGVARRARERDPRCVRRHRGEDRGGAVRLARPRRHLVVADPAQDRAAEDRRRSVQRDHRCLGFGRSRRCSDLQGVDTPKVSVIHDPGPDPIAFRPDLSGDRRFGASSA